MIYTLLFCSAVLCSEDSSVWASASQWNPTEEAINPFSRCTTMTSAGLPPKYYIPYMSACFCSVLRVCTCICLCDSVLQLSELKQTMKRLTLSIFSMKKERQSPGHLKHAHLYNSGWITGFYLSTVSSIVVIKYGLGVFMRLITTFLCKTPLAVSSTSSHWSGKYPLFQPKTLCTMFKVSIARCNQVLNKSVLLQH